MNYVTAGESHGSYLTALINGVPSGIAIDIEGINADLERRASGYGRSERQKTEADKVIITAGVESGRTTGAPVAMMIGNAARDCAQERQVLPRPGHADLVGTLKYNQDDCRPTMERASARESAARVAAAGVAREFLAALGVEIVSYVVGIGEVSMPEEDPIAAATGYRQLDIETSEVRCPDEKTSQAMMRQIDEAIEAKDSVGGVFRVVATGLVPGLGGFAQGHDRLTSQLGAAVLSIPSVKGVEFGLGFASAGLAGSSVHDEICVDSEGFSRRTNNAGGLEGGMSTGMPLIITAACKPVPTLADPLDTVNIDTLEVEPAPSPRADVCVVPAAAVVAEAEVAFVLAEAYLKKFGSDNMADIKQAVRQYTQRLRSAVR